MFVIKKNVIKGNECRLHIYVFRKIASGLVLFFTRTHNSFVMVVNFEHFKFMLKNLIKLILIYLNSSRLEKTKKFAIINYR
jgi:hypothetical protein